MYNEDDKLEYVECTCTILAVRRKRRVEVKGENNILKCVGGGRRGKIAYLAAALGPLAGNFLVKDQMTPPPFFIFSLVSQPSDVFNDLKDAALLN